MTSPLSRRELVAATAAISAGALVSQPIAASSAEACPEIESLESELSTLEHEIAEFEELVEDPNRNEELFLELADLFWRTREPQYSPDIHDVALDIGASIRDSVVVLDLVYEFDDGFATAWVVDDGYLLTNAHNVDDHPDELRVVNTDGEAYDAQIVEFVEGQRPDVALLETDYPGEPLPVGSSSDLVPGDPLVQVGHPGDFGYWVISLGEFIELSEDVLATIPGLQGNSGSPIVNFSGEVVAMAHAGEPPELPESPYGGDPVTDAFGLPDDTVAVPIETAMDLVEEWR